MADVVKVEGFGERMGKSLGGVVVGFVLFVVAFPVLFWNEGRTVKTRKGLEEGAKAVVSVKPDKVDAANEKKLVHLNGEATTDEILTDERFPAVTGKLIRLTRDREVYNWKEIEEKKEREEVGGKKVTEITYKYEKAWVENPIDSGKFRQDSAEYRRLRPVNPQFAPPCDDADYTAKKVTIGAFRLPDSLFGSMASEAFEVKEGPEASPVSTFSWMGMQTTPKLHAGGYYFGADPGTPQVGDVRVKFRAVKPQAVSILGQQIGETLGSWATSQGTDILRLDPGTLSAEQMFAAAQAENTVLAFILRFVGWLIMFIGLRLIADPLRMLGAVIPFVGQIIGLGATIMAFLAASALSLIAVSIAWLFYRPLIGVPMLLAALGLLYYMKTAGAKKIAAQPAPAR